MTYWMLRNSRSALFPMGQLVGKIIQQEFAKVQNFELKEWSVRRIGIAEANEWWNWNWPCLNQLQFWHYRTVPVNAHIVLDKVNSPWEEVISLGKVEGKSLGLSNLELVLIVPSAEYVVDNDTSIDILADVDVRRICTCFHVPSRLWANDMKTGWAFKGPNERQDYICPFDCIIAFGGEFLLRVSNNSDLITQGIR